MSGKHPYSSDAAAQLAAEQFSFEFESYLYSEDGTKFLGGHIKTFLKSHSGRAILTELVREIENESTDDDEVDVTSPPTKTPSPSPSPPKPSPPQSTSDLANKLSGETPTKKAKVLTLPPPPTGPYARWDAIDGDLTKPWKTTSPNTVRGGKSDFAAINQVISATRDTLTRWTKKALAHVGIDKFPNTDEECYACSKLLLQILQRMRHHYKTGAVLHLLHEIGVRTKATSPEALTEYERITKLVTAQAAAV